MISAHLKSGGVVLDSYRNEGSNMIAYARMEHGDYGKTLRLRCPERDNGWGTSIPDSDRLELDGHEVHYFPAIPEHGYIGKIVFLLPAPCAVDPAPSGVTPLSPSDLDHESMRKLLARALPWLLAAHSVAGPKDYVDLDTMISSIYAMDSLPIPEEPTPSPLDSQAIPEPVAAGCEVCGGLIPVGGDHDLCTPCRLGMFNDLRP